MRRKSEILFRAMGELPDTMIEEALRPEGQKRRVRWRYWSGLVAVMALIFSVGLVAANFNVREEVGTSGASGTGVFMSYDGPVFPLTLGEENPNITAQRTITWDFSPWVPVWQSNEECIEEYRASGATSAQLREYEEELKRRNPEGGYTHYENDVLVEDDYILHNWLQEEQVVEIRYPFVSSLRKYRSDMPTLVVDGGVCNGVIVFGGYAGGFQGTEGKGSEGSLNLNQFTRWEDYRDLLQDGTYEQNAKKDAPDVSQIPVTLYRFSEFFGEEESEEIPNPTMRVWFDLDYSKTRVLSYGFHAGWFDEHSKKMGKGRSIPQRGEPNIDESAYLILIGDDIQNLRTEGYATGGWSTEQRIEAGVTIERVETNLNQALQEIAQQMYREDRAQEVGDFALYYEALCEYLMTYIISSEQPVMRYSDGCLEDLDFEVVNRVFYLCDTITIPAGGTTTLTVSQKKEASYDFICAKAAHRGINGYDMVTALGSNLDYTTQTARLRDRGQIELVRQNFGFDLERGVNEVELSIPQEHYFLEVRRKTATK